MSDTLDHAETKIVWNPAELPQQVKPEMVNHPKHYNMHPSGIECIEIIRHMPHNVGAAMKYLWRMDHKDAPIEDLQKAIWYIQDEIALREGKFKK